MLLVRLYCQILNCSFHFRQAI